MFGSKNLKAISVIGSGSIDIADPEVLLNARTREAYSRQPGTPRVPAFFGLAERAARPQGCSGCFRPCRARYEKYGNESKCQSLLFSTMFDKQAGTANADTIYMTVDLAQRLGINTFHAERGVEYMGELHKMGILGRGRSVECELPLDHITDVDFAASFLEAVAYRRGIGDELAEGFPRAAEKWGRLEEDSKTGVLAFPYWGYAEHGWDERCDCQWGYGTILGERDCNEHGLTLLGAGIAINRGQEPGDTAEELVKSVAAHLHPY